MNDITQVEGEGGTFMTLSMIASLNSHFGVTGGGGVRKTPNLHDIIYEWSLSVLSV